jgi:hypothetical protein
MEKYTWRAVYDHGESCHCENEDNSFTEVDKSRVTTLLLLPLAIGGTVHYIDVPSDAEPIFFRRRSVECSLTDGSRIQHPTKHCIGWKNDATAQYLFVFEDDTTLLTNDLQAV